MPHFSGPFCCQRLPTLAFYFHISGAGSVLGPVVGRGCLGGSGAGQAPGQAGSGREGACRRGAGSIEPLSLARGGEGVKSGVGPCPAIGTALLCNWDCFIGGRGRQGRQRIPLQGCFSRNARSCHAAWGSAC